MVKIGVLMLLILGIGIGLYLGNQPTKIDSQASANQIPKQMLISNIFSNSFTVSWITQVETIGFIVYGEGTDLNLVALDDRDLTQSVPRKTHYVTLKNLEPGKPYNYKVGSNSQLFSQTESPLQQSTASESQSAPPPPETIFGQVILAKDRPVKNAMIYAKINQQSSSTNNGPLLSVLSGDGSWLINLTEARRDDLQNFIRIQDNQVLDIFAQTENGAAYTPWLTTYRDKQIDLVVAYDEVPFYKMSLGEDPLTANSINFANQNRASNEQAAENSQANQESFFSKFFRLLGNLFKIG